MTKSLGIPDVTIVIPVKNEIRSIGKTLDALFAQTRKANEIIITDGGSTDGTIEFIRQIQKTHTEVKLLCLPQAFPGHGRNHSIRHASSEIIACVDSGCFPESNWLAELTQPFDHDYGVVLGHVSIDQQSEFRATVARLFFPPPGQVDLNAPPWIGGNIAFTKEIWKILGGFPEDQRAAEDFVFWQRIREREFRLTYVSTALVIWDQPTDIHSFYSQQIRYSRWMTRTGHIAIEPIVELGLLLIFLVLGAITDVTYLVFLPIAPFLYVLTRMIKSRRQLYNWLTVERLYWVIVLLLAKPTARVVGLIQGLRDQIQNS